MRFFSIFRLNGQSWFFAFASVTTFALAVLFWVLQTAFDGSWAIGWFFYLCFATMMTAVRIQVQYLFRLQFMFSL